MKRKLSSIGTEPLIDSDSNTMIQTNATDSLTTTVTLVVDNNNNINTIKNIPHHIALVCDGNTRWAKQQNQPTMMGHFKGANRTIELIQTLRNQRQLLPPESSSSLIDDDNDIQANQYHHYSSIYNAITHLTLYAFSTENWNRPHHEIQNLFRILEQTAIYWYQTLQQEDQQQEQRPQRRIIIKFVGNLDDPRIPNSLRTILYQLQARTPPFALTSSTNETTSKTVISLLPPPLTVCIAINYGGRQDIVRASQRLMMKLLQEKNTTIVNEDDIQNYITETNLHSCLDTHDMPDPDLFIRTSGEVRLSNFLLWNVAYTELYFTNTYWPDFTMDEFHTALLWYSQRQRRFGGTS